MNINTVITEYSQVITFYELGHFLSRTLQFY